MSRKTAPLFACPLVDPLREEVETPRIFYTEILVQPKSERNAIVVGIKIVHTAVWLFFAGCIVALPIAGVLRQFRWAVILSGLVMVECAVLAMNRGRCPLTDVASRYTEAREDNFDIYLPRWLARHNKLIFGTLFVAGELFVAGRWWWTG